MAEINPDENKSMSQVKTNEDKSVSARNPDKYMWINTFKISKDKYDRKYLKNKRVNILTYFKVKEGGYRVIGVGPKRIVAIVEAIHDQPKSLVEVTDPSVIESSSESSTPSEVKVPSEVMVSPEVVVPSKNVHPIHKVLLVAMDDEDPVWKNNYHIDTDLDLCFCDNPIELDWKIGLEWLSKD